MKSNLFLLSLLIGLSFNSCSTANEKQSPLKSSGVSHKCLTVTDEAENPDSSIAVPPCDKLEDFRIVTPPLSVQDLLNKRVPKEKMQIEIVAEAGILNIHFTTIEDYNSACTLEATDLIIQYFDRKVSSPIGIDGTISFNTEINPDDMCAQVIGPQRGVLSLRYQEENMVDDGTSVIEEGVYELIIDEISYGTIIFYDQIPEIVEDDNMAE